MDQISFIPSVVRRKTGMKSVPQFIMMWTWPWSKLSAWLVAINLIFNYLHELDAWFYHPLIIIIHRRRSHLFALSPASPHLSPFPFNPVCDNKALGSESWQEAHFFIRLFFLFFFSSSSQCPIPTIMQYITGAAECVLQSKASSRHYIRVIQTAPKHGHSTGQMGDGDGAHHISNHPSQNVTHVCMWPVSLSHTETISISALCRSCPGAGDRAI